MILKDDAGEILCGFGQLFKAKMQDGNVCTFEILFPEKGAKAGARLICVRLFDGAFTRDGHRVAIQEGRNPPLLHFEESALVPIIRAESRYGRTEQTTAKKSAKAQKGLFE